MITAFSAIANSYAKGLFDVAKENNAVEEWSSILTCLSLLVQEDKVARLIKHPKCSMGTLKELFMESLTTAYHYELGNFIALLYQYKRLVFLPEILKIFHQLKYADEATLEIIAKSAFVLSNEQESQLNQCLQKHYKKTIRLVVQYRPELIGGIKIIAQNEVIDQSILGRFKKMISQFKSEEKLCS